MVEKKIFLASSFCQKYYNQSISEHGICKALLYKMSKRKYRETFLSADWHNIWKQYRIWISRVVGLESWTWTLVGLESGFWRTWTWTRWLRTRTWTWILRAFKQQLFTLKWTVLTSSLPPARRWYGISWVFSHGGLFMTPHRARMSDKLLSSLVFLKCSMWHWQQNLQLYYLHFSDTEL